MEAHIFILALIMSSFVVSFAAQTADNNTVHFFLLMVPESKVESLKRRAARQEEGAVGAIAEAVGPAANVGQILQGILGGDLRPIFAGSTAFIPEGDFREGITEILQQTVAPGIQRILMEFNKNVQRHFNATSTTPSSVQQQPINNGNNQFQQQNFNNYNNPYQQGNFQQPNNFNQFQQQNQNFGGGIGGGGIGGGGIGGGAIGGGGIGANGIGTGTNFNNQYNPNFQQNPSYQQQNYLNTQLQQPNFSNNQIGQTQFHPHNNFQSPNYNQYQQQPPMNNQNVQGSHQNSRPPFGSQFQSNSVSPPQSQHQFQPPPQTFPQPINSNHINQQFPSTKL